MKTKYQTEIDAVLPPELAEILEQTPSLSVEQLKRLESAGRALDEDPQFLASVLKSKFVNEVYAGMEETGTNKNNLAQKWGKSRQYLSRLLNEGKRINFTIETMVELVHLLGKRLELNVVGKNDVCHMLKVHVPERRVVEFDSDNSNSEVSMICSSDFQDSRSYPKKGINESSALAANEELALAA